jgi:hypothetical protein
VEFHFFFFYLLDLYVKLTCHFGINTEFCRVELEEIFIHILCLVPFNPNGYSKSTLIVYSAIRGRLRNLIF